MKMFFVFISFLTILTLSSCRREKELTVEIPPDPDYTNTDTTHRGEKVNL